MRFLKYGSNLRRSALLPLSQKAALYGVRPLSYTRALPASVPRYQLRARLKTAPGIQREINLQEVVQADYMVEDSVVMDTLQELGIENLRTAERIFRLQRTRLLEVGSSPASAAQLAKTSDKWKSKYAEHMSTVEAELMTSHRVLGALFYAAAMTDLSTYNQASYWEMGKFSLQIAFEFDYEDAAIAFARIELRANGLRPKGDPQSLLKPVDLPPKILGYIHRAAMSRSDWRAMSLYLDYALRKPQNKVTAQNSYQIAVDLSRMAGPSSTNVDDVSPSERYELPWFQLQKAADEYYAHLPEDSPEAASVQQMYVKALNTGRDRWNDSRAAELLLRNTDEITPGSTRWVELLTQAAMQGNPDSCFKLGHYLLRQEGWHPDCLGSTRPQSRTSFWWIELSAYAMRHYPVWARQRYLLLAVLLRENGFEKEAKSYLIRGQLALKESQAADAGRSIQWLQNTIDEWDSPEWDMTSIMLLEAEPLYKQKLLL